MLKGLNLAALVQQLDKTSMDYPEFGAYLKLMSGLATLSAWALDNQRF
jgi:hypothetical protein